MIQGDDAEIQEAAAADTAAISQGFLASQLKSKKLLLPMPLLFLKGF